MRQACEGFEAIFIQKMWEQMRASLPKEGLLKSKEEQYWQSMYDQELGKSMASAGGIGLADMMMVQLGRNNQEMSDATRDSAMRRTALEVSPAPLLPPSANVEHKAQPVAQPTRPTAPDAASRTESSIYEGEASPAAPEPAPLVADSSSAPTVTAATPAQAAPVGQAGPTEPAVPVGQTSPVGPTALPVSSPSPETSSSVRQTLDELKQMVQAQPQTAQAKEQADAAPVIVRTRYQTNLPPGERKVALLDDKGSPATRTISLNITGPTSTQGPGSLPTAPAAPAVPPNPAVEPEPVPHPAPPAAPTLQKTEPADILAGITPRFIPARLRAEKVQPREPNFSDLLAAEAELAARPTRAGGPSLTGPETPAVMAGLGNPAPPRGSLTAPVGGQISSGFGWRIDPFTGRRAWHAGLDLKAEPGEPVRAARDGVVSFAGYHPELGYLVEVDHGDNLRTLYGHNRAIGVSVGQRVSTGMELAQAGSSGRAAGTHVHFEVRRGDLALNPEPLLQQGFIRIAQSR